MDLERTGDVRLRLRVDLNRCVHEVVRIRAPTFETVRAGDHWSLRMSRHIPPVELMLQ